ncbi:MAG TPA: DUF3169 family protein [Candidatus Faecivivens stercoripullorum]|uniref:DUF3169 family protein n=1 Tax=Candidatus Faecivivens stercoripullorum TaxID=2840805 RepID=A0A9D1H8Y6_9FIRM|nr:DUF3169 family protein [Candidatus Faecivivens stercoripullorum]
MKKNNIQVPEEIREKQLEIHKEDKKSLPKLLLFMLCAAIIGFPVGLGMGYLSEYGSEWLIEVLQQFWLDSALWIIPVFTVLLLVPSLLLSTGMKKAIQQLDEEDEAQTEKIDGRLSISMLLSAAYAICMFFGMGVILSVCIELSGVQLIIGGVELIAGLTLASVAQKRAIDLTKILYPEKHGSVFDTNFTKVWEESCDEREKTLIWKSAYGAYKTTFSIYPILFLAIAACSIPFGYGPLPAGIVLLMWLIQTVSYCLHSIRNERRAKKDHKND